MPQARRFITSGSVYIRFSSCIAFSGYSVFSGMVHWMDCTVVVLVVAGDNGGRRNFLADRQGFLEGVAGLSVLRSAKAVPALKYVRYASAEVTNVLRRCSP